MELRTYTLADAAALDSYVSDFWPRHIRTLAKHGITVHGVWTDAGAEEPCVIALVGYLRDRDAHGLAEGYRNSSDFAEDHQQFDASLVLATRTQTLQPIAASPLH